MKKQPHTKSSHHKRPRRITKAIPRIVCICGSTSFYKEFIEENRKLTMAGAIVVTVGVFANSAASKKIHGRKIDLTEREKTDLDALHKRKIDLADEVLILNVDGHVGDSTRSEIAYAKKRKKPIRWLEPNSTRN